MMAEENRIGFGFNNPDLDNDYYFPGWGLPVTPDELRYIVLFGVRLTSSDQSQTYTDEMIQIYIDNAIGIIEADLQIDIFPRIIRHEDAIDMNSGARIPRTDIPEAETRAAADALFPWQVREPGYVYREQPGKHYLYLKLRRRPLIEITKAVVIDPLYNTAIDIYTWRKETTGLGAAVQFFPNKLATSIGTYPLLFTRNANFRYPFDNFPGAIMIDYKTGYPNVRDIPRDLLECIRLLSGIALLNDFGDGRTAALASQSTNLNSISESFTTTMSATNAMYGARIIQFRKQLEEWWKRNYRRYQRSVFGALG